MAEQTHVLFVEDDDVIRRPPSSRWSGTVSRSPPCPTVCRAWKAFRADRPDIALLDVMVPGLDGVSLRRIRDESTVPVIMLSARADSIDVVLGLEAGADDYVTKPFDGAVLVARIRAVLRRFGHASGGAAKGTATGPTRSAAFWLLRRPGGRHRGHGGTAVRAAGGVDTDRDAAAAGVLLGARHGAVP